MISKELLKIKRIEIPLGFNSWFVYIRLMNASQIYLFNRYSIIFRMPHLFNMDWSTGTLIHKPTMWNRLISMNINKFFRIIKAIRSKR